jgi:hypothetical protein
MGVRISQAVCLRLTKDGRGPHHGRDCTSRVYQGLCSEADFSRIPGCRLIDQADVPTGMSSNYFVSTRRSVKANLFRVYLLQ